MPVRRIDHARVVLTGSQYSYFVNDHKQSFRRDDLPDDGAAAVRTTDPERLWELESSRRLRLRQVLFSDLHE